MGGNVVWGDLFPSLQPQRCDLSLLLVTKVIMCVGVEAGGGSPVLPIPWAPGPGYIWGGE